MSPMLPVQAMAASATVLSSTPRFADPNNHINMASGVLCFDPKGVICCIQRLCHQARWQRRWSGAFVFGLFDFEGPSGRLGGNRRVPRTAQERQILESNKMENKRVLAIASGGGHWQQLMRLRPAFENQDTVYVTTNAAYEMDVPGSAIFVVTDANRDEPLKLIRSAIEVLLRIVKNRPDVVISTGAAPGLFAIIIGRCVGARTIWVDSIANAEAVSLSGRVALRLAHIVLTQWPHLAQAGGPQYQGSIL